MSNLEFEQHIRETGKFLDEHYQCQGEWLPDAEDSFISDILEQLRRSQPTSEKPDSDQ